MSEELEMEDALLQIRNKLQADGIKLWLPPYYKDGPCNEELEILSNNYYEALRIPLDVCLSVIKDLQINALEKLKERDRFKETGIATFKIRVSDDAGTKVLKIEMRLSSLGADLKNEVTVKSDVPSQRLKLIASGKVIQDDQTLQSQGVKNGTVIMAVILHENPGEIQNAGIQMKELEAIKEDTNLLANNTESFYMNLEDQSGNVINLPQNEKKSLMVAMALHEKGRAALKNEDYSTALVMFLDADKEFCNCNSKLLESVDNYALLNLDIVWCYLCLKSVSQVPEAEERLRRCEQNFHKSYGPNLERLMALKGTTGNEAALFMRLHLLQAIVMYHQNRREEALHLLQRAEDELKVLKVDDGKLMALVELGFSIAEARLGLRATFGNVDAAAEYINEQREQRTNSRKKNLEEFLLNKERKKLGMCADGQQYVEPQFLRMLTGMGYPKETARIALQQCNNNISSSVQMIQENPHLMELARASSTNIEPEAGHSRSRTTTNIDRKKEKELEALNRLHNAIPMVDDDHLDLSLEQEEIFLQQYKSLLITE